MRIPSLACVLFLSIVGCAPGAETSGPPSCDQVCSNIATQCGAAAPGCASACASFGDDVKRCVASASSCGAAEACVEAPTPDASVPVDSSSGETDSGSMTDAWAPNPDPCSVCTRLQYCVRDPGVTEIRCWDPPDTCNGAPPEACDACFYEAGIGPCAGSVRGCTSGAAGRSIDCQ